MLRSIFLFQLFSLLITLSFGQKVDSLQEFQTERLELQKNGMLILGSWSLVNISSGAIGYSTSTGESRYFHQMNAGWNLFNLGLSISGYLRSQKEGKTHFTSYEIRLKQQRTEDVFLFNSALNFTYITAGFLLLERAKNTPERFHEFKGFGTSLILQGAFLFTFDIANYIFHRKRGKLLL